MRIAAVVTLGLAGLLTACATKGDLRDLGDEVAALRSSQRDMIQEVIRQNEALLDSMNSQNLRMRGDLLTQLNQMERQLVQIQELTGQSQARLSELRQQVQARGAEVERWPEERQPDGREAATGPAAPADELYQTSMAALRRGSFATARAGFQELMRSHPNHELASEAQFQIGESYAEEGEVEEALDAYATVLERYADAPKAPTALYRAGVLEMDRGNRNAAREVFNQLTSAYPRSAEAQLAADRLRELRQD
jgi:tol-pal system protein YbgF